jgi:hypothetical protein
LQRYGEHLLAQQYGMPTEARANQRKQPGRRGVSQIFGVSEHDTPQSKNLAYKILE